MATEGLRRHNTHNIINLQICNTQEGTCAGRKVKKVKKARDEHLSRVIVVVFGDTANAFI